LILYSAANATTSTPKQKNFDGAGGEKERRHEKMKLSQFRWECPMNALATIEESGTVKMVKTTMQTKTTTITTTITTTKKKKMKTMKRRRTTRRRRKTDLDLTENWLVRGVCLRT